MQFKEVLGLEILKGQLLSMVHENRVSHAMLFLGTEGGGNLAMALAFAQFIHCTNKTEDDSCGQCAACIKSQKLIHPDTHFTFPIIARKVLVETINKKGKETEAEVKKESCNDWLPEWRKFLIHSAYHNYQDWIEILDAENKQGDIPARECLDIIRKLSLKSYESEYKISIIWLPEYMGNEANRILKIVEEPPDKTVFLFVAIDAERIINTILSRLQLIRFPRLHDSDIAEELQKKQQLTEQKALQIAAMSDGNYRRAISLLETSETENTQHLRNLFAAVYTKNMKEVFIWNDAFAKWGREAQKNFLYYCIHFFREIILIRSETNALIRLTEPEMKMGAGLASIFTEEKATQLITLFDKSIYFIERNANPKILAASLSLTIYQIYHQPSQKSEKFFFEKWEV